MSRRSDIEIIEQIIDLQSRISYTKGYQENMTDEQKEKSLYNPKRIKQMENYVIALKWALGKDIILA